MKSQDNSAIRPDLGAAGITEINVENLVMLWTEVLGVDDLHGDSDLFEYGANSLQFASILARLRSNYGATLSYRDLLGLSTPHLLAEELARSVVPNSVEAEYQIADAQGESYALSPMQRQIWVTQRMAPGTNINHIAVKYTLCDRVNIIRLSEVVSAVVNRHAALSNFVVMQPGGPMQARANEIHVAVEETDDAGIRAAAGESLDLSKPPLLRIYYSRNTNDLLFVIHHFLLDGWSLSLFMSEIGDMYAAPERERLDPPDYQYRDFVDRQARWLAGEQCAIQLETASSVLRGIPPVADLPLDRAREMRRSFRAESVDFRLAPAVLNQLEQLAGSHRTTLSTVLLAAYCAVIERWSGETRFCIGVPVSNREDEAFSTLIGLVANTLAIPIDLTEDRTCADFLRYVGNTCAEALDRQSLPFDLLVQTMNPERDPSHNPIFQMMFSLNDLPSADLRLEGTSHPMQVLDATTIDVDLHLELLRMADGSLEGGLRYATDVLNRATAERLLAQVAACLDAFLTSASGSVRALPLVPSAELARLDKWGTGPSLELGNVMTLGKITEVGRSSPRKIAVVDEGGQWDYGQLLKEAASVARSLRREGVAKGTVVAILLPRDRRLIAGLLGTWAADCAYLPLDPELPVDRLKFILEDAEVTAIVCSPTDSRLTGRGIPVVSLGNPVDGALSEHAEWPEHDPLPGSLAYMIYTSGSTGKPKGVLVDHLNLHNLLTSFAADPGFKVSDRMLALTSMSFDIAALEVFLPLRSGGTLVLAPRAVAGDGAALHTEISRHAITHVQATPATWELFVGAPSGASGECGESLRQVWCGGEELTPQLATRLCHRTPAEVRNCYGPTETTIWSTQGVVNANVPVVGLGRAVANTKLSVVDRQGRPVGVGSRGELSISGLGVSRGYHNRPILDQQRFSPDGTYKTGDLVLWTAEGVLQYLGRLDDQVKVRGYRIEPGEIAECARTCAGVVHAVVTLRESRGRGRYLALYYVGTASPSTIRKHLAHLLPGYMIPDVLTALDELPLTASGKIDRRALPEPIVLSASEAESGAIMGETERKVLAIWQRLLPETHVGLDDNFFLIGGSSLTAGRAIVEVGVALRIEVQLIEIFQYPTVRSLSLRVDALLMSAVSRDGSL